MEKCFTMLDNDIEPYEPEELYQVKFKQYRYGFDSGYCVKAGITEDNEIYILKYWKFSDDETLNKLLDDHIMTVNL